MDIQIYSPQTNKLVEDYDFTMTSGLMLPVTLDLNAGDTIDFGLDVILVYIASKPSITDPDKMLPAENMTIFVKHLVSVQHRTREVPDLTPEQAFEWKKTLADINKTIQ